MMADARTFITVHDGMPDHPKVDPLSDAAFRLLIETWCWCSRHLTDGFVSKRAWEKRGKPKARRELLEAGLVEEVEGGIQVHDYLEHQRSSAEVRELREARAKSSLAGNHQRWHVDLGVWKPDCPLCQDSGPPPKRDPKRDPGRVPNGSDRGSRNPPAESPESSSESSSGSVSQSLSRRNPRATPDDDLEELIIKLVHEHTGHTIGHTWAARVRSDLLDGRRVDKPGAYLRRAIGERPWDFVPADERSPAHRSAQDAIAATMRAAREGGDLP